MNIKPFAQKAPSRLRLSILLPLLLSGAALFVIGFLIYPGAKSILRLRQGIADLNIQLTEQTIPKRIFLENLEKEKSGLVSDLNELTLLLPNEPQPPLLLATIETAANQQNLELGSLQYTGVVSNATGKEQKEPGQFLKLNFLIKGDEEKIIAFLKLLSEIAPLNIVEKVSIEELGQTDDKTSGSLTVRWFFEPLLSDLGDIEEPISPMSEKEKETVKLTAQFKSLVMEQDEEVLRLSQTEVGKINPFE